MGKYAIPIPAVVPVIVICPFCGYSCCDWSVLWFWQSWLVCFVIPDIWISQFCASAILDQFFGSCYRDWSV